MEKIEYGQIVEVVQRVFLVALQLFKDDPLWTGRTGAMFALTLGSTPETLDNSLPSFDPSPIGTVPKEKEDKYRWNASEKGLRLFHHPDHLSSWQSRDMTVEPKLWGGAIRVGTRLYSISGLPELGDEAVMLAVALAVHNPNVLGVLDTIAGFSHNPYWPKLRRMMAMAQHEIIG